MTCILGPSSPSLTLWRKTSSFFLLQSVFQVAHQTVTPPLQVWPCMLWTLWSCVKHILYVNTYITVSALSVPQYALVVPWNFVSHWTQKCVKLPLYLFHSNNTGCFFHISYFNLVVVAVCCYCCCCCSNRGCPRRRRPQHHLHHHRWWLVICCLGAVSQLSSGCIMNCTCSHSSCFSAVPCPPPKERSIGPGHQM